MSTQIRANSILPGRREDIELHTADGLTLVGELAVPVDRAPVATLVCLHPLPTHGGMMDSHIIRKAAWRLPALAGIAVLRFNTRGTSSLRGTSEGAFDAANGERFDVAAAIEYAEFQELPRIWLLGWSFGTDLVLKYGCDPAVVGAILLSPSLRFSAPEDLQVWGESGKPVPAAPRAVDDYSRVPGAKHLWVGDAEKVLDEIVKRVSPETPVPLPREWDGPMEYGDASAYADRTVAAFADVPVAGPAQRRAED